MPKQKEPKMPKYYTAEVVEPILRNILSSCTTFGFMNPNDFQVLFKNGKNKLGRKHVIIKFVKEPMSFTTDKKLIMLVTNEWYDESTESERIKGIIEALLGVVVDEENNYCKRDYDYQTYTELLNNPEYDYSEFSKVLPAESKKKDEKFELKS